MAQDWILGIDFGTSNTAAAHTSPSGNGVQVLPLSHQSNLMPSAVYVESPETVFAGDAALNKAEEHPQALLPAPKRMLGFGMVPVNGYEIPPSALVAAILRLVYERALSVHNNEPPSRVVLTHPEAWSLEQVGILTDAAALVGIEPDTITTISEPRAAVHYYTRTTPLPAGATIAVFDFGAGTLDVAVLKATDTRTFEVVAARGDNALGGKNFDALVRRWVDEQLTDRDPQLLEWLRRSAPPQDIHALDGQIRRAKELLSDQPNATIRVTGNGYSTALSLTREEFEQIIGPQIDRALELTRHTLADAGVDAGALDALYLTGGSSRIPLVHRRLSELGPVATLDDPKTVVAQGALFTLSRTGAAPESVTDAAAAPSTASAAVPGTARTKLWLSAAVAGVVLLGGVAGAIALARQDTEAGAVTAAAEPGAAGAAVSTSARASSTERAVELPAAVASVPRATAEPGTATPRGNIVGTFGDTMTRGCSGEMCDLAVSITGIDVNPKGCEVYGSDPTNKDRTVVVHYTVATGPNPVVINGALLSSITWSAVDSQGSVQSNLNGSRSGDCGDYESQEFMPNSKYDLSTVIGVPQGYDTLIWRPNSYFADLTSAPGLEFAVPTT
ncbi:Hsp70 family protein [Rhodococcus sp. CX]|uniref:Hsp70 family protein n=1 Tax=Rhodococcus sp. CX TaxID=2789880 RepID=UPI0018CEDCC3|nr:Hsp70 family protein [Rhodococcus sp. CX]MBH0122524.1 Hsp70 family protein [Rhodococcus sp. CX]